MIFLGYFFEFIPNTCDINVDTPHKTHTHTHTHIHIHSTLTEKHQKTKQQKNKGERKKNNHTKSNQIKSKQSKAKAISDNKPQARNWSQKQRKKSKNPEKKSRPQI